MTFDSMFSPVLWLVTVLGMDLMGESCLLENASGIT